MKNLLRLLALAFGFCLLGPAAVSAAQPTSIRAILITASNDKAESDPRLKAYENELQRNLVFSSFRFVNEGSAAIPANGRSTLQLADGHTLELEVEKGAGVRVRVVWTHRGAAMMSTSLPLKSGSPAVLVRRGGKDDNVPVILVFAR